MLPLREWWNLPPYRSSVDMMAPSSVDSALQDRKEQDRIKLCLDTARPTEYTPIPMAFDMLVEHLPRNIYVVAIGEYALRYFVHGMTS